MTPDQRKESLHIQAGYPSEVEILKKENASLRADLNAANNGLKYWNDIRLDNGKLRDQCRDLRALVSKLEQQNHMTGIMAAEWNEVQKLLADFSGDTIDQKVKELIERLYNMECKDACRGSSGAENKQSDSKQKWNITKDNPPYYLGRFMVSDGIYVSIAQYLGVGSDNMYWWRTDGEIIRKNYYYWSELPAAPKGGEA